MTEKKKGGRPKKEGGYTEKTHVEYLELCEQGKTLSEIAKHFKVDLDTFKKWVEDPKKSKLKTVWKLGQTYFQAFHENLYQEMVKNRKDYDASQRTGQKTFLEVYTKEWNIKKESTVTVNNKWDQMSEKDINRELQSAVKRKNNKALIYDILELNDDTAISPSREVN